MKPLAKLAAVAALAVAFFVPGGVALAAYPGSNGEIAFVRADQIWTMNADGTGQTQLTSGATAAKSPEWSPDGSRIAYSIGSDVHVMNADGTSDQNVFHDGRAPTWAPDGRHIALIDPEVLGPCGPCFEDSIVRVIDPDGSHLGTASTQGFGMDGLEWSPRGDEFAFDTGRGEFGEQVVAKISYQGSGYTRLAPEQFPVEEKAYGPAWSPGASEVTYLWDVQAPDVFDVWRADADASGAINVTSSDVHEYEAEWSPDASKIVYTGEDPACTSACNADVWVTNADGTGRIRLTNTSASEAAPDWQPVVGPPPPGYPRPRGATPFYASLVPAYNQCTAPNRTHGSPLAFGSCAPPGQASPRLTVGTPDVNGAPAKMLGSLRIDAIGGNAATPSNEADAKVTFDVADVRCNTGDTRSICLSDNAQGGRDYGGGIRVRIPLRLTDRYNLPAPGGDLPATMIDAPIELNVACLQSASDTSVGSSCSTNTSTAALIGATEGRRANYELGQVVVLDGGAAGNVDPLASSTGMSPFLRQGLFVP